MYFILTETVEREIHQPEFFQTHEQAHYEMCSRLAAVHDVPVQQILERYSWDPENCINDESGLTENAAWTERYGNNFDWKIFDISEDMSRIYEPAAENLPILFWQHYEYETHQHPLAFLDFHAAGMDLKESQVIRLLQLLDEIYGDTNQETPVWALEFQLLTRMLVHEKALLINPLYLDLGECDALLPVFTPEQQALYLRARELTQEDINNRYKNEII